MRLQFTRRELRDLLVAWIVLGVAFTIYIEYAAVQRLVRAPESVDPSVLLLAFAVSLATAGVGFLLHELAHKVVAIRFGQIAGFRADYEMLLVTLFSAVLGFLFAAPGAVYHRGRVTARQRGLVALAGPMTNLVLTAAFLGIVLAADPGSQPLLAAIGWRGLLINVLLAGFNMVPFGPLDGRTVLDWNKPIFAVAFAITAGPAVALLFGVFP